MVIICSAPGCTTKKDTVPTKTSVQFHRFPLRKPDVLSKWVKSMKNPNFKPTVTSYLCEAHFTPSDYEIRPNIGRHLKSTAVPTIFEKRRPGRKKKLMNENETLDLKETPEEHTIKVESIEPVEEEEYLDDGLDNKTSNLADIIEDPEKEGLQILVVGEDGKITNYQYVFKKELLSDEESKQETEPVSYEECRDIEEDNESLKGIVLEKDQELSEDVALLKYRDLKYREKINSLESNLSQYRRKVKVLQSKYRKANRKLNTLKILLKLLVLKKGRGEKSIQELLQDYEKQLRAFILQLNSEVNEETEETDF